MAHYTIELKDVIANGHNIFDFKYPFYDEKKRQEFEEKFIRHFYFREIGCPTVDRFKHYLHDKFDTVFPFYNELFKSALIEYSILNNYNLTEEFTTTRENQGKSSGISSTVGQAFGTQETEGQNNRTVDTTGKADTIGVDTENETGNSKTVTSGNTTSETNGTSKTDTEESGNGSKHTVQKYLDTPQGLTDLSDSNYITNLTDVNETDNNSKTGSSETVTNGDSETNNSGESETDTTRNATKNSTVNQTSEGSETTIDKTSGTVRDEQKTTQDNNSRTYMDSKQTETHKLTRVGNIGVDTDSDMIEKHIQLQKKLRSIELSFFDECEDLFMLVY